MGLIAPGRLLHSDIRACTRRARNVLTVPKLVKAVLLLSRTLYICSLIFYWDSCIHDAYGLYSIWVFAALAAIGWIRSRRVRIEGAFDMERQLYKAMKLNMIRILRIWSTGRNTHESLELYFGSVKASDIEGTNNWCFRIGYHIGSAAEMYKTITRINQLEKGSIRERTIVSSNECISVSIRHSSLYILLCLLHRDVHITI